MLNNGNPNVILCERGIRTFETAMRNTFDVAAIALLKQISHLPVIADPSHAADIANWSRSLARMAVAAGADGLIVEVHPNPEKAWSDGEQSLDFAEFDAMMVSLEPYLALRAARLPIVQPAGPDSWRRLDEDLCPKSLRDADGRVLRVAGVRLWRRLRLPCSDVVRVIVTAAPAYDPLAALRGARGFHRAHSCCCSRGQGETLVEGFAASADASVSFDGQDRIVCGEEICGGSVETVGTDAGGSFGTAG